MSNDRDVIFHRDYINACIETEIELEKDSDDEKMEEFEID
jgi:hypothetical protein